MTHVVQKNVFFTTRTWKAADIPSCSYGCEWNGIAIFCSLLFHDFFLLGYMQPNCHVNWRFARNSSRTLQSFIRSFVVFRAISKLILSLTLNSINQNNCSWWWLWTEFSNTNIVSVLHITYVYGKKQRKHQNNTLYVFCSLI